jgi:ankyrin repeat protein/uncharacterized protein YecT (DUF1311 family)
MRLWNIWLLLTLATTPTLLGAASFDCTKARSDVEKLICADDELSRLDEAVANAYEAAKTASWPSVRPVHDQRGWLVQRNACRDRRCVKSVYENRLRDLQSARDDTARANENLKSQSETIRLKQMAPVRTFLQQGGDSNARNEHGATLLEIATSWNDRDAVKALLEKGADPNQCKPSNECALYISAGRDTEILRLLVAAGADVNRPTTSPRYTALGYAAGTRRETFASLLKTGGYRGPFPDPVESVRILLASGANVNHVDSFGESPLRTAMRVNNLAIARLLLQAGADVHQRQSREGGAWQRGDTILMGTIDSYSLHKDQSAIQLLLDFGANPNDRNEDRYMEECERSSGRCDWAGNSALTFAASRGLYDVVRLLLERGADPSWERTDGRDALKVAEKHRRVKTAALLKQYMFRTTEPPNE